jgi:hypothetical protein
VPGPYIRSNLDPAAGEVPVAEFGAEPGSRPTVGPFVSHAPRTDAAPTRIMNRRFFMVGAILRNRPVFRNAGVQLSGPLPILCTS